MSTKRRIINDHVLKCRKHPRLGSISQKPKTKLNNPLSRDDFLKLNSIYIFKMWAIFLFVGMILKVADTGLLSVIGISLIFLFLITILVYSKYPLCRIHARKTLLVSPESLEIILFLIGHLLWILIYTGLVLILISKVIGLFQPYTLQMLLRNDILFLVSTGVAGVTYYFLVKLFSSRLQFYET